MDTAGKDSAIKHVMSGINPQGCGVRSFKRPSDEENDHDYLWRSSIRLPERGRIGIFNRSYYEEVLVVRVHRDGLEREKLPPKPRGQGSVEEPLQGHSRLRTLPHPQRHAGAQILPSPVEGRTAAAFLRTTGQPLEELEVLVHGPHRAPALGQDRK